VWQLELDPVGVVEEDGVVARRVVVLRRTALDPGAVLAEPARPLVDDLTRGNVEADVVDADGVAVVGGVVGVGALLAQTQRGDTRALDREIVDRLALLAARFAKP